MIVTLTYIMKPGLSPRPCLQSLRSIASTIFLSYGTLMPTPKERVLFYNFMNQRRLRYADHILTISRFIRQEICNVLMLPESAVSAVPLAAAHTFYPRSAQRIKATKDHFNVSGKYLLFVGSLEPRKNLPVLIQAAKKCDTTLPLILVGWEAWGDKSWIRTIKASGMDKRVVFTGHVDDETLACLYSGASALVYPSLYEGFGLPILEAMACACPVICSDTTSMPEVSGEAAIRINPTDVDDLAAAIDLLASDQSSGNSYRAKGLERSTRFSWRRTAEETRAVFETVAVETTSK